MSGGTCVHGERGHICGGFAWTCPPMAMVARAMWSRGRISDKAQKWHMSAIFYNGADDHHFNCNWSIGQLGGQCYKEVSV